MAAARQFALEGFQQRGVVPGADEGLHRHPMRRRGADDRQLAQSAHRHVERAWNRRGGQGQQVHIGFQGFQRLFMAHAEALFLIDDDQTQIVECHVFLQTGGGCR